MNAASWASMLSMVCHKKLSTKSHAASNAATCQSADMSNHKGYCSLINIVLLSALNARVNKMPIVKLRNEAISDSAELSIRTKL